MIKTKNQEKKFDTLVVASLVEVCYFGGFDYKKIFELASFITGEDINMSNIAKYREIIIEHLKKDYPELNRNIYLKNGEILSKKELSHYKSYYIQNYGDKMIIKSIKKIPVKILK